MSSPSVNKLAAYFKVRFASDLKSLTDLSYDDENKRSVITDTATFYCYDSIIKREFDPPLMSPDMIDFVNDTVVLTEFKYHSQLTSLNSQNIRMKAYEGSGKGLHKISIDAGLSHAEYYRMKKKFLLVFAANNVSKVQLQKVQIEKFIKSRITTEFIDEFKIYDSSSWVKNRLHGLASK